LLLSISLANVGDLGSLRECGADDDSSFSMFGFGNTFDASPDDMRDGCGSGDEAIASSIVDHLQNIRSATMSMARPSSSTRWV